MKPAITLFFLFSLVYPLDAQEIGEIPTLSPREQYSLIRVAERGQPVECKPEYDACPKGRLEITHIRFEREHWTAFARCIHIRHDGKREIFYINIKWLVGFPSYFATGFLGPSAWYNKSSSLRIRPEFMVSHITYIEGHGLIARCHYRRDLGTYSKTNSKQYVVTDRENYATRLVHLRWLTFNSSEAEEGAYED